MFHACRFVSSINYNNFIQLNITTPTMAREVMEMKKWPILRKLAWPSQASFYFHRFDERWVQEYLLIIRTTSVQERQ